MALLVFGMKMGFGLRRRGGKPGNGHVGVGAGYGLIGGLVIAWEKVVGVEELGGGIWVFLHPIP